MTNDTTTLQQHAEKIRAHIDGWKGNPTDEDMTKLDELQSVVAKIVLPIAQANKPAWANDVKLSELLVNAEEVDVVYIGPAFCTSLSESIAYLNQSATIALPSAEVTHDAIGAYIYVEDRKGDNWTPETIRTLAAELLTFADHLESVYALAGAAEILTAEAAAQGLS